MQALNLGKPRRSRNSGRYSECGNRRGIEGVRGSLRPDKRVKESRSPNCRPRFTSPVALVAHWNEEYTSGAKTFMVGIIDQQVETGIALSAW